MTGKIVFRSGIAALLAMAGLAGCNDPGFERVTGVREAGPGEVAACRYISNVSMRPGVYGPLADQAMDYARNAIFADAKSMGANAVVFDPVTPGIPVDKVTAVAYAC
ncbi:MAG: hypothetical protein ACKVPY_00700 [Paracoccaceae bacterium]